MSNTDTMKQVYLLAQEHCGLKVGDWVRVTWENPNCSGFVRNAGTVEVVREMKALPEGSQND